MTIAELETAVDVLHIEKDCLERDHNNKCNKDCLYCELSLPPETVLKAYDLAIESIRNVIKDMKYYIR